MCWHVHGDIKLTNLSCQYQIKLDGEQRFLLFVHNEPIREFRSFSWVTVKPKSQYVLIVNTCTNVLVIPFPVVVVILVGQYELVPV